MNETPENRLTMVFPDLPYFPLAADDDGADHRRHAEGRRAPGFGLGVQGEGGGD